VKAKNKVDKMQSAMVIYGYTNVKSKPDAVVQDKRVCGSHVKVTRGSESHRRHLERTSPPQSRLNEVSPVK
jgi:hypothetical protein